VQGENYETKWGGQVVEETEVSGFYETKWQLASFFWWQKIRKMVPAHSNTISKAN
jgi:hypothetical protein